MRNSSQVSFLIQGEFAKIIIQVSWSSNLFALLILRQSTEESGLARELKSISDCTWLELAPELLALRTPHP